MKYLKKKQKNKIPVILGIVIILLCVLIVAMLLALNARGTVHQAENAETDANKGTNASENLGTTAATMLEEVEIEKPVIRDYEVVELIDGQIQTPYCALSYPEGLTDLLLVIKTSEQPYTLEFYAVMEGKEELRLFDISMGAGSGGNMGVVMTPEGEIPLNVTIYTLTMDETWSEGEITTAYAMQDAVNDIIEQMAPNTEENQPEAPIISEQPDEDGTINNLEIETPYCVLYYPARWAGTVSCVNDDAQEEVYKVHFYSRMQGQEDQLMFSIYFGGDEGDQLGVVMGSDGVPVPVYLVMGMLQLDGLSEDEVALICAMQEAANQVIERLPLLQ